MQNLHKSLDAKHRLTDKEHLSSRVKQKTNQIVQVMYSVHGTLKDKHVNIIIIKQVMSTELLILLKQITG